MTLAVGGILNSNITKVEKHIVILLFGVLEANTVRTLEMPNFCVVCGRPFIDTVKPVLSHHSKEDQK